MYASWERNKERGEQRGIRGGGSNVLHQKLCEHVEEELEEILEYHRLSEQARDAGEDELAELLYEIAKDEYSHAKYIYEHLKKIHYPMEKQQHFEQQFYRIKQL